MTNVITEEDILRNYKTSSLKRQTTVQLPTYEEGIDPRKVLFDLVKEHLNHIDAPYGNRVLVATAPHCDKSSGGIIYTSKRVDEGRYQGKVGLILMTGPTAFKYDGMYDWEGPKPSVGDWVYYRPTDSYETGINGVPCRFIRDELIIGRVTEPEAIY
jgi:co-chaperonin GroES (HSP10)